MTGAERAEILVTARLLEAARTIDWLSTGLTLIAAFGVKNVAGIAVIVLGVVAKIYGFRVAFDARLFRDIAEEKLSSADLDAAFPTKAGRSWSDRCRGAKRLVIVLGVATLAQGLAMAVR